MPAPPTTPRAVLLDVDGIATSAKQHDYGLLVRAAGMRAVAFRSGGWTDEDLRDAEAVYADPADLLACYDGSPFTQVAPNSPERAPR